ncbi:MAG: hypothetical protein J2P17_00885 [Mycobacterium sp.]|nr:hypothetical protein [Mycobacterium sp.]
MAEPIEVNADQLSDAACIPETTSEKIRYVVDTLWSTLAGLENDGDNQPWGNDRNGKKFSDGDRGYKAIRNSLVTGGCDMADALQEFADGERSAAEEFKKAESSSAYGF